MHMEITVGQVFGYLKVIKQLPSIKNNRNKAVKVYLCECLLCGKEKTVTKSNLTNGSTTSCGCARRRGKVKVKHGLSKHPLHTIWRNMKDRCKNPNNKRYERYGGRGIVVCEEWDNDFKAFYDWCMNNGWQQGLQIDRINNDGDYEPSNCRFVTNKINANNKSTTYKVIYNSREYTLSELSDVTGIKYDTLNDYYHRNTLINHLDEYFNNNGNDTK